MVAALNCWWPDGQAYRSIDGGKTWTALWEWGNYPTLNRYYTYDDSLAPWIGPDGTADSIVTQIGWMMESLVIDPFDSNHWLYGTGETIYGGHDLLKWDTSRNVTLKSLADGIEETSVQGLISPPVGPPLLSSIGDVGGKLVPQHEYCSIYSVCIQVSSIPASRRHQPPNSLIRPGQLVQTSTSQETCLTKLSASVLVIGR